MFVTALYAIVDTATQMVRIACAGHPSPLKISADTVTEVAIPSGPPVGIMDFEYPDDTLPLVSGDRLLFITDGVFDAKNPEGKRLGMGAMLEVIRNHAGRDNLIQILIDHVDAFANTAAQADDTTIAEIRADAPH